MAMKTARDKFLEAIEQCQVKKIISLVKQGYNIHMQNTLGQNFLVHILQQQRQENEILRKKHFQIFQFLITNYNLNIHSLDIYGKNLFNWATNLNCTDEALYLLQISPGDIDILIRDHTGSCSLHYAVEHGNEILVHAIVNYLLRYRLRFDIKDAHNNTPEDLARNLGYEKIRHFLEKACRSTVFFSREIPDQSQLPMTAKSKSSTSLILSSFVESSEYFNFIESKINLAKDVEDWKTVAELRASRKNLHEKRTHRLPDPSPRHSRHSSINISPPNFSSISTISQPEQMLHLLETQLCTSYCQPFVPVYQRTINTNVITRQMSNVHRKMSQASTQRKRDSELSQISVSTLPDVQNRLSIPAVYKQNRQSIVTTT